MIERDYDSAYHYFHETLISLASEPHEQCQRLQYESVAWFLKREFLDQTNMMLHVSESNLSARQLKGLAILTTLVGLLPETETNTVMSSQKQEEALKGPCWASIRESARELIKLLDEETSRVNAVLWPTGRK